MTQAPFKNLTFEEYLDCNGGTDTRYELVRGRLVPMNPPTGLHILIAKVLERIFDQECRRLNLDWEAFRETGQRTERDSSRLPDVMVVRRKDFYSLLDRSAVLEVSALIAVEIVSKNSSSIDYGEKLDEYQVKGIREYWVVNPTPKAPRVTIYTLDKGRYGKQDFRGHYTIRSTTFPELELTANHILNPLEGKS